MCVSRIPARRIPARQDPCTPGSLHARIPALRPISIHRTQLLPSSCFFPSAAITAFQRIQPISGSDAEMCWTAKKRSTRYVLQCCDFVVTTKPVLTVPATFDFNQETKTIYWTEITGGSPYEIWLRTDQNIKVLHDREYFETSYNLPTALPKGTYRVWVCCVASYYAASTWSLPAVFGIN